MGVEGWAIVFRKGLSNFSNDLGKMAFYAQLTKGWGFLEEFSIFDPLVLTN
jgi:hypothetical protein